MLQFLSDSNQANETMFIERKIKMTFSRITKRNEIRLTPVYYTPYTVHRESPTFGHLSSFIQMKMCACGTNFLNKFI